MSTSTAGSGTDGTTLLGFQIPEGTVNPYAYVQAVFVSEMYPPFAPGFEVRIAVLLGILAWSVLPPRPHLATSSPSTHHGKG